MIAEEATFFLSVLWQCSNPDKEGEFVCVREGVIVPSIALSNNPLSFAAQERAYLYLFGKIQSEPQVMAREIESWVDPAVQVRFCTPAQAVV